MEKNLDEQLIEQSFKKMYEQYKETINHYFYLNFKDEKHIAKFDELVKKYLNIEFKKSGNLFYYKCDAHTVVDLRNKINNVLVKYNHSLLIDNEKFNINWLEKTLELYNFNVKEINYEQQKDFTEIKEKNFLKKSNEINNKELFDKTVNYDFKNFKDDWINFLTKSFDIENINSLKEEIDKTFKILQEKHNDIIIYKSQIDETLLKVIEQKSNILHKDWNENQVYDKNKALIQTFDNHFNGNNYQKPESIAKEIYEIIYQNFKNKNINFTKIKNDKVKFDGIKHKTLAIELDIFSLKPNINKKYLNIYSNEKHHTKFDNDLKPNMNDEILNIDSLKEKDLNFIVLYNLIQNYQNIFELKQIATANNEFKRISKLLDKKHYEEFLPEIVTKLKNFNNSNNLEQKELGI